MNERIRVKRKRERRVVDWSVDWCYNKEIKMED